MEERVAVEKLFMSSVMGRLPLKKLDTIGQRGGVLISIGMKSNI